MDALRPMSEGQVSLVHLLGQLKDDTVGLVQAEVALVRAELLERVGIARGALVPAVLAVALLHAVVLVLAAALVAWLGQELGGRYALAALLVAAALLVGLVVSALVVVRKLAQAARGVDGVPVPGKYVVEVLHERTKQG
jgi:hypothetical protein